MGWAIYLLIAASIAGILWRWGGFSRTSLELLASALLVGLAGYAWQGNPSLAGSPVTAVEATPLPEMAEKSIRKAMSSEFGAEGQWLDLADSLIKIGHSRNAVSILSAGLKKSPNNPDLWVGLGNALVVHSGGQMSPAAQFAFEKAATLSPNHPGPPFFLGLALAQSGKMDEAGDVWRGLLARAPADAPWKADLEARLAEIGQTAKSALKPLK
jgi:cytochrome c-type biogenesis protein CcmH